MEMNLFSNYDRNGLGSPWNLADCSFQVKWKLPSISELKAFSFRHKTSTRLIQETRNPHSQMHVMSSPGRIRILCGAIQVEMSSVFQLCSGRLPASIAVIRISGPKAEWAAVQLSRRSTPPLPRRVVLTPLFHPETRNKIDPSCLMISFPAPKSFTGEDVVELQVHGSPVIVSELFHSLRFLGLEEAGPGEFTRRAFRNGKMDLTQAEGLADLLSARTRVQKQLALSQIEGGIRERLERIRKQIIQILSNLEAIIDFGEDEEDVDEEKIARLTEPLFDQIAREMEMHLTRSRRGEMIRDGVRVAIAGEPNAGKSSLLNAFADRDVAIVSGIPGTTRDILEVAVDYNGVPLLLADTAGLRDSQDEIEREGIARARKRISNSEVVLVVIDSTQATWPEFDFSGHRSILVLNKWDALSIEQKKAALIRGENLVRKHSMYGFVTTTCLPNQSDIESLQEMLGKLSLEMIGSFDAPHGMILTRERHRVHIENSLEHLHRAQNMTDLVLKCEEIRITAREIGSITGFIDIEEVLDTLFKDFCIGK